jgi:hypothetical protein
MTAVDSGRQRRMAWALTGLAVVGLALTVLLVVALPGDWRLVGLLTAVLTGIKTGLAVMLFRTEWVTWPAATQRIRRRS